VLIVDDDPAAHDLLTAKLKGENYRLVHAKNGEAALELARKIQPDAITLDVLMPKIDGWTILSALKADRELRDIPVVMVTVAPERSLGLSLGAVDVITKPVDRVQLGGLLRRVARREGPVLVVDDDAGMREIACHAIAKLGLSAAGAENGRSALLWLIDNPAPAIILLDLMMPEMDGFDFLEALKHNRAWRDIPVIAMTGLDLTSGERDRLLGQVRTVIAKGASINVDIATAVSEAVRRRPSRDRAKVGA
jgi:CheY-like chemotaxis protein